MKYSDVLRIVKDQHSFGRFLAKSLDFPDDTSIDSIDLTVDDEGNDKVMLNCSEPSTCPCCGYNYFGLTISVDALDKTYDNYLKYGVQK
jgi:hypothetical protein